MSNINYRKLRRISIINAVRNILVLIIILSVILYQAEWFKSASNMDIFYDLSNYQVDNDLQSSEKISKTSSNFHLNDRSYSIHRTLQSIPMTSQSPIQNPANFQGFFEQFILYSNNTNEIINITAAALDIFQNSSIIDDIESYLGKNISSLDELIDYFLNSTLYDLFIDFMRETWNKTFNSYIPDGWYQPGYIYVRNNGRYTIKNISVIGSFESDLLSSIFTETKNIDLSSKDTLEIVLDFGSLLNSINNIAFEAFINITLERLSISPNGILEDFNTYLLEVFKNQSIYGKLAISANMGLIPFKLNLSANITNTLKNMGL